MESYQDFAQIYDKLMLEDINYAECCDFIENIFDMHEKNPKLVMDLACGTGNITIPMAKRGYDMTGADISEDMLSIAREKSMGSDILFLQQNLSKLDLYGTMDAFLCMIDGFNYILVPKILENLFKRIKTCFLEPGGLLIFDISSRYKLSNTIGNNTFIHNTNEIFYTWENTWHEGSSLADMFLTFFVKSHSSYQRFSERHIQRGYTEREIRQLLTNAGFSKIDTYDGFSFSNATPNSDRIVFVVENG